jgi:putative endonuclease
VSPHPRAKPAEDAAARYLRRRGLKVVERNFNTRLGEIDLIALDGHTVVFVEVRSRAADTIIRPEDTVNARKQAKLRRTAEIYLKSHGMLDRVDCRFDVVALTATPDGDGWSIEHYPHAF